MSGARHPLIRATTCVIVLALTRLEPMASARAGGSWHIPHPHSQKTPEPGRPRSIPHTHERAGWPLALSAHARPSRSPGGIGYQIGGGALAGLGDGPTRKEGTWGHDDTGLPWHRHRVRLGWWHGRRSQGGRGAYRTDGHAPPDLIAGASRWLDSHHESHPLD